jgi:hypothetical protein
MIDFLFENKKRLPAVALALQIVAALAIWIGATEFIGMTAHQRRFVYPLIFLYAVIQGIIAIQPLLKHLREEKKKVQ